MAKQSVFCLKSVLRSVRIAQESHAREALASHKASVQTFCLTAVRAYLNTQKYGLFCSLKKPWKNIFPIIKN